MVAAEVIYLIPLSHGNFLAAEGVVLGHSVEQHRLRVLPGAYIINVVCCFGPEGVVEALDANKESVGGRGFGQPGGPVSGLAFFVFNLIIAHPGLVITAAPGNRNLQARVRGHRDRDDRRCGIVNRAERLGDHISGPVGDGHIVDSSLVAAAGEAVGERLANKQSASSTRRSIMLLTGISKLQFGNEGNFISI